MTLGSGFVINELFSDGDNRLASFYNALSSCFIAGFVMTVVSILLRTRMNTFIAGASAMVANACLFMHIDQTDSLLSSVVGLVTWAVVWLAPKCVRDGVYVVQ